MPSSAFEREQSRRASDRDRRCVDGYASAIHRSGCGGLPLITGGSGVAMGLPAAYRGGSASSSSSEKQHSTLPQDGRPSWRAPAPRPPDARWRSPSRGIFRRSASIPWRSHPATSSAQPVWTGFRAADERPRPDLLDSDAQRGAGRSSKLGRMNAGEIVEKRLRRLRCALPERGFTRLMVAGGETSGAVVKRSTSEPSPSGQRSIRAFPGREHSAGTDLALALKSGNFGAPDFFLKAWSMLR